MAHFQSCYLKDLNQAEQQKAWNALSPAERGFSLQKAENASLIDSNIFVQNKTGLPLVVYVQRHKMVSQVQQCNLEVNAGSIGVGFIKKEHEGRVMKMAVHEKDTRQLPFKASVLSRKAFVTVALNDNTSEDAEKQLFCQEYEVQAGQCLVVKCERPGVCAGECFKGHLKPQQGQVPAPIATTSQTQDSGAATPDARNLPNDNSTSTTPPPVRAADERSLLPNKWLSHVATIVIPVAVIVGLSQWLSQWLP